MRHKRASMSEKSKSIPNQEKKDTTMNTKGNLAAKSKKQMQRSTRESKEKEEDVKSRSKKLLCFAKSDPSDVFPIPFHAVLQTVAVAVSATRPLAKCRQS